MTLKHDRGAADPILVIVSMTVSLLVSAAIIGALTMVIALGARFTAEQATSSLLGSAATLFAQDAQNATAVRVHNDRRIVFVEGGDSGLSAERGSAAGCRVGVWAVDDGALVNKVARGADGAACPDEVAGREVLRIPGIDASTVFVAVNAAGRVLQFEDGVEVGSLDGAGEYWTDGEWADQVPRTLTVMGSVDLPVAGQRDLRMPGKTWLAAAADLGEPTGVEEQPVAEVIDPGEPTGITVTRSTIAGTVYGLAREGIHVVWDSAHCGPYSPSYDVTWMPSTAGVATRTASIQTFDRRPGVDLPGVPNGSAGTAEVVARCPAAVSDTPASSERGYFQPLPSPVVFGVEQVTAERHLPQVLPVTSLPAQYAVLGGAVGDRLTDRQLHPADAGLDPARPVVGLGTTWPAGHTFGRSFDYMVEAKVDATLALSEDTVRIAVAWPAIPAVAGLVSDQWGASGAKNDRVHWTAVRCPAGTSGEHQYSVNSGAASAFNAATVHNVAVAHGGQYRAVVTGRCVSPFTTSPNGSPVATVWNTNVPSPPAPGISIGPGGTVYAPGTLTVSVSSSWCTARGWSTQWFVNSVHRATTSGNSYSISFGGQQAGTRSFSAQTACVAWTGVASSAGGAARASKTVSTRPPPAVPTVNVTIVNNASTRITARAVSGATSYEWQLRHVLNGSVIRSQSGPGISAQIYLPFNQGRMRACHAYSCSSWSGWKAATYQGG